MKALRICCLLTALATIAVGFPVRARAEGCEHAKTCCCPQHRSQNMKVGKLVTGGAKLYAGGKTEPFARVAPPSDGLVCNYRVIPGVPFVLIDVAPAPAATNRIVRRIDLPQIKLMPFEVEPVTVGSGGLTQVDGHSGSFAFLAIAEPKSRRGVVVAWLTNEKLSGVIRSGFADGARREPVVDVFGEYGRMSVAADSEVPADTLLVGAFDDCRLGLEQYADLIAQHYAIRLPKQLAGYTTWYDDKFGYSHKSARWPTGCGCGTAESALEFAAAVRRHRLNEYGFDFYQIDDHWQEGNPNLNGPARNFFEIRKDGPFPSGFAAMNAAFAALGVRTGVWFMPFGGISKEPFFADKQDIFARAASTYGGGRAARNDAVGIASSQRAGAPFETVWGGTVVDSTSSAGRDYVARLCRRLTGDWGFRYLKYDGIWTGHGGDLMGGKTWRNDHYDQVVWADPTKTGVEALRLGLKTLREASAPGTFLLGCNLAQNPRAMAASYGLTDGMRIGGDNGPIDVFPARYLAGPIAATPRYFFNGRVWYNDPDPVYVRDAVSLGRARLFASWAGLNGTLYNFSDYLPTLSDERVEILKRTLTPHGNLAVRPIDYFEHPICNVWTLDGGTHKVIGLFNWSTNEELKVDYDLCHLDLNPKATYVGWDFWANAPVPPFAHRLTTTVPPDSCRILQLVEVEAKRPVLVSTSRHVASPVLDVVRESWDASAQTLSGTSKVVSNETYELRLRLPEGLTCTAVGDGRMDQQGQILRVTFKPTVEMFDWKLSFGGTFSDVCRLDRDFVRGLVAIPSESRNIPACNRAVEYVRNYLEKRGVFCHVERTVEGRDALYASTVPGKTCDYAFVSHIDVVPAASPDQFVPRLIGDELYGRGACDTKVNAALIVQLLVALKGKVSVGAFLATDEDGCCGKVPTCTLLRRAGYTPKKMILVGDTTGDVTNRLLTAQKGHWGFKLTAKGAGGHSSVPWRLDNAIPKITAATERIVAAYPKPKTNAFANTLSPTILTAGDAPNAIPGEASVTFSFRYVGKDDVEKLRRHVRELTGLEPETLYCVPPVVNDPNDPLIQDLIAAMQVRWPDAALGVEDGATDAFQFSDLNLPTVIYAPDAHGAHQPDEHGSLRSAEEYLNFFIAWLQERK